MTTNKGKIGYAVTAACGACQNTRRHKIVATRSGRLYECPSCGHFATSDDLRASDERINSRTRDDI